MPPYVSSDDQAGAGGACCLCPPGGLPVAFLSTRLSGNVKNAFAASVRSWIHARGIPGPPQRLPCPSLCRALAVMGVLGEGGMGGEPWLPWTQAVDDRPSVTAASPAGPGSQPSAALPAQRSCLAPLPKEGAKIGLH